MEQEIINQILQHIQVLNEDYSKLAIDVAILKTQMDNLMWWFKAIAGGIVVLLISQFWQVFKINKNGICNKK